MHNIKEREREFLFLTFYDINPRIMCKLQPGKKHVAGSREGGGGSQNCTQTCCRHCRFFQFTNTRL